MTFDLADEFRGEAEEGGHHVLGHALNKGGEGFVEVMIAFLSGEGVDKEEVLLGSGEGALDDEPEIAVQQGHTIADTGGDGVIEDGNLGSFDRLDVKPGRLLPIQALIVCDPPVLDGKLDDLFDTVVLDEVHPETAF